MAFVSIDNFRSYVPGIARSTLFEVVVSFPNTSGASTAAGLDFTNTFKYTCKAASIPSSTFGKIEVPFMGRKIYYAGDRQYNDWNTTIIVDNDWSVYKDIYNWHMLMNDPRYNVSTGVGRGNYNMNAYKGQAEITAFDQTGAEKLKMRLDGFFPYDMQELTMDWANTDAMTELTVVWAYDFSEIIPVSAGDYGSYMG